MNNGHKEKERRTSRATTFFHKRKKLETIGNRICSGVDKIEEDVRAALNREMNKRFLVFVQPSDLCFSFVKEFLRRFAL